MYDYRTEVELLVGSALVKGEALFGYRYSLSDGEHNITITEIRIYPNHWSESRKAWVKPEIQWSLDGAFLMKAMSRKDWDGLKEEILEYHRR